MPRVRPRRWPPRPPPATTSWTAATTARPSSPTTMTAAYFLGLLARYRDRFGLRLYHYCLMSNHFHLLLQLADPGSSPLDGGPAAGLRPSLPPPLWLRRPPVAGAVQEPGGRRPTATC